MVYRSGDSRADAIAPDDPLVERDSSRDRLPGTATRATRSFRRTGAGSASSPAPNCARCPSAVARRCDLPRRRQRRAAPAGATMISSCLPLQRSRRFASACRRMAASRKMLLNADTLEAARCTGQSARAPRQQDRVVHVASTADFLSASIEAVDVATGARKTVIARRHRPVVSHPGYLVVRDRQRLDRCAKPLPRVVTRRCDSMSRACETDRRSGDRVRRHFDGNHRQLPTIGLSRRGDLVYVPGRSWRA